MKTSFALAAASLPAFIAVAHAAPPAVLPANAASAVKVERVESKKEERAAPKVEMKSAKAPNQDGKGPMSPDK